VIVHKRGEYIMAGIGFGTNYDAKAFGAFGRTVQVLNAAKSNMTQAEVDALVQALQLTNSVSGISAFTAGETDAVSVAVEGPTVADATIAGFTVTTTVTFTTN
jgi:hypothetical protein